MEPGIWSRAYCSWTAINSTRTRQPANKQRRITNGCTRSPACERVLKQRLSSGLGDPGRYPAHPRRIEHLNFSLKSLVLMMVWLSFAFALFAYTRSLAITGKGWSIGTSSELLLVANIFFMLVAIALAIGTLPERHWLTASVVAAILVAMQLMNWIPTNTAHMLGERIVLYVTPTQNLGTSGWRDSFASEFASLLIYSWTPILATACGRVTNFAAQRETSDG